MDSDNFVRISSTKAFMWHQKTEALRKTREEANDVLDRQFDTLNDLDTKTSKVLRMNLLVAGLLVSASSIAVKQADGFSVLIVSSGFLWFGMLSLLNSIVLASLNYTDSEIEVGISSEGLRSIVDDDIKEEDLLKKLNRSYATWIEKNSETLSENADLATFTLFNTMLGIIALAAGITEIGLGLNSWQVLLLYSPPLILVVWYVNKNRYSSIPYVEG